MKVRPINFAASDARRIIDGAIVQERRFGSAVLTLARPGDWLWLREPFRLEPIWDAVSPAAVLRLTPRPKILFEADSRVPRADMPGKRRPGYMLPRALSRVCLRVIAVRDAPLHEISPADLAALGRASIDAYAAEWDERRRAALAWFPGDTPGLWAENPIVRVADFETVHANIDRHLAIANETPPAASAGEARPGAPNGARSPATNQPQPETTP